MRKLIRDKIIEKLGLFEWDTIDNKSQLNDLYVLKVKEELHEIINANFNDGLEFADLIEVAYAFAKVNGFSNQEIDKIRESKRIDKGGFSNFVLTNLNPNNDSNKIYLTTENKK